MIKKIIIFLYLILYSLSAYAGDLDIKPNIEGGTYNGVLEIYLVTSGNNKSFYYTDGEGRMDNIKEFNKNPIIIKEDTTLNYYTTGENYESSLIGEAKYTFNYSDKIDINYENNKIIIKNNSVETQNIGYWGIEGDNLNYTIYKNTFLEPKETFKLDYEGKNNEILKLYSPDRKIIKDTKIIFEKKEEKINNEINTNNKTSEIINDLNTNSGITQEMSKPEDTSSGKEITKIAIQAETQTIPDKITNDNSGNINNYIKSSVLESNSSSKEDKKITISVFFIIIFTVIFYKILTLNEEDKIKLLTRFKNAKK